MYVSFKASESVEISIANLETPIQHYLRQPQRLVKAIADPRLIKHLDNDLYELKMRPINFMEMYHFQPIVLLKVWSGSKSSVYLQSEGCQIEGIDYINRRFSLKLKGVLYPQESSGQTTLQGQADLEVGVELPTALMFTPKPLLEIAGNKLLKSVLMRIKQKLVTQLIQDYLIWASQANQLEIPTSTKLAPDLGF
ncbi:hypothetical protein NIES4102_37000 [Chondrocystis sp. NIES-4102]|nr:hypothetical protein NIES4102_37000 [Chondrocystis sp. NIES-4102]